MDGVANFVFKTGLVIVKYEENSKGNVPSLIPSLFAICIAVQEPHLLLPSASGA